MRPLPPSNHSLIQLVEEQLHRRFIPPFAFNINGNLRHISAVLFLLGQDAAGQPLLILNKRSQRVRQPGDLCCPGGGVSPAVDSLIAKGLRLPAAPLFHWPRSRWWHRHRPVDFCKLSLLLAAALREGFEEMRLNPLGVKFLGPMPAQHLVMFRRAIYPVVGWVNRQRRFLPNWEVEKIVRVPLAAFFDSGNYARFRLSFHAGATDRKTIPDRDMPCFVHRENGDQELLWGATYRIVVQFLTTVFGYDPPPMQDLPVIHRRLGRRYLNGSVVSAP